MNRRMFGAGLAALSLLPQHSAAAGLLVQPTDPLQILWTAWKSSYLAASGRVVDALQGNISHSEGQGYGLYLAACFGDSEGFALIFDWTEAHLAVRDDRLLAWRWSPDSASVTDPNNASDGDLFYAWALMRASQSFGTPAHLARARDIVADLVETCIVSNPQDPTGTLLLPAVNGFLSDTGVMVNPSYYMLRAMRELADATSTPQLAACARDGDSLLTTLAEGGLVPDWILVTADGPQAAEGFSHDAGYEALRVPLLLIWSGQPDHPAVLQAQQAHAGEAGGSTGTVFDRVTMARRESSADAGYGAIAALIECAVDSKLVGSRMPAFSVKQPYYPATLQMFAILAQIENLPRCFPI